MNEIENHNEHRPWSLYVREFLDDIHWDKRAHPECESHDSTLLGHTLKKEKWADNQHHLPLLSEWGYTVTSGLLFLLPWPAFWGEPCLQTVSQSKPLCHLFIYYLLYFYYLWSVYSKISWIHMWSFTNPQPFSPPHFLICPALLFHHMFTCSFLKMSSESTHGYQYVCLCTEWSTGPWVVSQRKYPQRKLSTSHLSSHQLQNYPQKVVGIHYLHSCHSSVLKFKWVWSWTGLLHVVTAAISLCVWSYWHV